MSERNTLVRSLHDVGLAAWFGGSLMGAVGLNGAAGRAADPTERTRLSSVGWRLWSPVSAAAIGAHAIGGAGLVVANRRRVRQHGGAAAGAWTKGGLTVAAAGLTAWARVLGRTVDAESDQGAEGATEPREDAPAGLSAAQRRLQLVQWVIPALTGAAVVLGAQQGEQQRPSQQLLGRLPTGRQRR